MVEHYIFSNLTAWNNFRTARLDGRSETVRTVLKEYRAKPVFDEDTQGQVVFNRIAFESEADQLMWLLRWS